MSSTGAKCLIDDFPSVMNPYACLTCVLCFQGQCLYQGTPVVHFYLELIAVFFCVYELFVLFRLQSSKGRLRRQLYLILLVHCVTKLLRDFLGLIGRDFGSLTVYAISLIPMTTISVDLVMVTYWSQVFYSEVAGQIAIGSTITNVAVHVTNIILCALRVYGRIGHHELILFWGISLGLMSLLYINFVMFMSVSVRKLEDILSPERLVPLRRSLHISGMVCVCGHARMRLRADRATRSQHILALHEPTKIARTPLLSLLLLLLLRGVLTRGRAYGGGRLDCPSQPSLLTQTCCCFPPN